MNRDIRRYTFRVSIPADEIEETLLLAVLAAEGLHGQARVRLDASYGFDRGKHACAIDAGSEVGRDICRMFTSFAIREFGETAFRVTRGGAEYGETAESIQAGGGQ